MMAIAREIRTSLYDWDLKRYPGDIQAQEEEFYSRIIIQHKSASKYYEDPELQKEARSTIPVEQLEDNAAINFALYDSQDQKADDRLDNRYFLLLELLNWFKTSFFTWLDQPECSSCKLPTERNGSAQPSQEDLRWGATRVESYVCNVCKRPEKFPRYNHPGKLLIERSGRCGEWANCFTLCCRAMGFEARFVLDWTDHVWTEVYSHAHQRWLHCDPCENICDAPLLYEVGWKKKLSYVIAFSRDQVLDVTWRYSKDHREVLSRRVLCREGWLLDTLRTLNEKLLARVDSARKKELDSRTLVELVEFLSPKTKITGEELSGRISGSMQWRLSRGETASQFVWKVTKEEGNDGKFHVVYNSASDKYVRISSNQEVVQGWREGLKKSENVFRKVESDWKMAYLCRTIGSEVGTLTWVFDLSDTSPGVDAIQVKCAGDVFENGVVIWTLRGSEDSNIQRLSGDRQLHTFLNFKNEKTIELTAELKGGRGDFAWQHAQLFRQKLQEVDKYPFEIVITFA